MIIAECKHCSCNFSHTDSKGKEICISCGKKWGTKPKESK